MRKIPIWWYQSNYLIMEKEENAKLRSQNNSPSMGKRGNSPFPINSPKSGSKYKVRTIKINNRKSLLSNKLHISKLERHKWRKLFKLYNNLLLSL